MTTAPRSADVPSAHALRWATFAVVLVVLACVLWARGCFESPSLPATPDPDGPTLAEARATVTADRTEAATEALLGRADDAEARADSLARMLAAERARTSSYLSALAATRARTDSALVVRTPPAPDVSADTSPAPTSPTIVATPALVTLLAAERVASDAAIEQCEARAVLSAEVAEAQRVRAVSAYAAADSALAALSNTRLAYVEADRRATSATQLATRRTRQRNALAGVAGLAIGCTAAVLLIR